METKAQIATLETKLVQLQITIKRTDGVLAKANEESIARHQAMLRAVTNEVDNLRLTVEAEEIAAKEYITEWNVEINSKLEQTDGDVRATKRWLEENKRKQETIKREEKIQFEVKLLETKLKLQAEHEKQKRGEDVRNRYRSASQIAKAGNFKARRHVHGLAKILGIKKHSCISSRVTRRQDETHCGSVALYTERV